jgi:restriction endonuclease S subunit
MQSISDTIIAKIKKCGRGKGYFVSDFALYGETKSIQKALERLVKSQILLRLARGFYYYPKIDKKLGLAVFAGYCIRFTIDPKKAVPEYIYWYTKTKSYNNWVNRLQRPSVQANINKEEYKSLEIVLPPI